MGAEDSQFVAWLSIITPFIAGGLSGSIFTLLSRLWIEKNNQKIIKFSTRKQRFSTPKNISGKLIDSDELNISYKNKNYSHLALYSVQIENTGVGSIEGQSLIFTFPLNTDILEEEYSFNVPLITCKVEDSSSNEAIIKKYDLSRIERCDVVNINFLVDCDLLENIQFVPRGTDNVKYIMGEKEENESNLEQSVRRLLSLFVFYILLDGFSSMFPFGELLHALFGALIVTTLIPNISNIINLIFSRETFTGENTPVSVTINNEGNDAIIAWGLKHASVRKMGTSVGSTNFDPIENNQE
jgi:hypothetical protein